MPLDQRHNLDREPSYSAEQAISGSELVASGDLRVLDNRESPEVEEVAARASVTGLRALAVGEMCQTMLVADTLADLCSPRA